MLCASILCTGNASDLSAITHCRSTLLKAMGQGLVVGFPKNLHTLYVEQLEGTDAAMSVLNTVTQADKEMLSWRQKASLLQVTSSHLPGSTFVLIHWLCPHCSVSHSALGSRASLTLIEAEAHMLRAAIFSVQQC